MTVLTLSLVSASFAADHAEAPGAASDPAADIADLYAWVDGPTFVAALTFAGLTPAGGAATYDDDVLYTVHVDHDEDGVSDLDVQLRFGQNAAGDWGVQLSGLAGQAPVSGAVETPITVDGVSLWAGLRDDPFFFDLAGYSDTLATGTLSFDSARDSLAGSNVTAIVFEGPVATFLGTSTTARIWATTARK